MMQTHIPELEPTVVTSRGGGITRSVTVESAPTENLQPTFVPEFKPTKIRNSAQPPDLIVSHEIVSEPIAKRG